MLIREPALTGQDQPGAVYTSPAKPSPAHSPTKVSHTSDDLYVIFIFIFSKQQACPIVTNPNNNIQRIDNRSGQSNTNTTRSTFVIVSVIIHINIGGFVP